MLKEILWTAVCVGIGVFGCCAVQADDLNDGMSEYTDENITAEDNVGANKDNNINYIVVDAIGKAKAAKKDSPESAAKSQDITHFADDLKDNNENSVVVEAGSHVDKVYNIVVEK